MGRISFLNSIVNAFASADQLGAPNRTPASTSCTRSGRTRLSGPTNTALDVSRLSKPPSMSLRAGSRELIPYDAYALSAGVTRAVAPSFGLKKLHAMELDGMPELTSGA